MNVTWDDILWAAVTVGRPDIIHIFRHGNASLHEALFRWSMVRMALQQRGPHAYRLTRTSAFKQMDPTEKGAVNYFLGLIFCKLFASKLLDAPWTLHLDVFRHTLNPRMLGGRSRPDMVAQSSSTAHWHAFECKGRASAPGDAEKRKAKAQAARLVSVFGRNCDLHVGAITFYRNDALEFYWSDPEPTAREPIRIPQPEPDWGPYYSPVTDVLRSHDQRAPGRLDPQAPIPVDELDLTIGLHPAIRPFLLESRWQRAHDVAIEHRREFASANHQPDGLLVRAGPTWLTRFEAPEFG